ncbi:MAG: NAD(P)-dependent oxidoreductase [Proteobacteria bacterium]|nr:NAD(P)-dependent oxidoreductase [Pseudomonadota bacterium]
MSEPVGFIGTGTIGQPMARRLVDAGHRLHVFDLDRQAYAPLVEAGATPAASPAAVAADCRIVFTSLPGPDQVRDVVVGDSGLLEGFRAGDVHVDLTTNSLEAVRELHRLEAGHGVSFLDAPVSGGAMGAAQGSLTVMASGSEEEFRRVSPLLEAFSSHRFYLGEPGNGTLVKLVNNAIFLCGGLVVQEAFVLAAKAGLDVRELLEIVKKSSGGVYSGLAGLFFGRDFDSPIFKLSIASKDVSLAVESAETLGVPMPVTRAAADLYAQAERAGLGPKVFFATLAALEEAAGIEVPKIED